jgi:Holliday junction resolvase RusA-like endonuclease
MIDNFITLKIKALSVNEAYKGRRFRTPAHDSYKTALKYALPDWYKLPPPPYCIHIEFGFSSLLSDADNGVKLFIDSLQDKYLFNDRLVKRIIIDVEKVAKGNEYIKFCINHLEK